jgi:hypothetical protein
LAHRRDDDAVLQSEPAEMDGREQLAGHETKDFPGGVKTDGEVNRVRRSERHGL